MPRCLRDEEAIADRAIVAGGGLTGVAFIEISTPYRRKYSNGAHNRLHAKPQTALAASRWCSLED